MTEAAPGPAPELDRRFVEYRRTGDRRIRDELVLAHRGLAERVALRYRSRGEPHEDLVQVATLGLLKAVERFDPDRGLAFTTFAVPTMLGELKRHFRDRAWSVRVPRALQELALEVNAAVGELAQELGRSPTVPELAARVGRREEDVLQAMEANQAFSAGSLDQGRDDDDEPAPRVAMLGVEDPGLEAVDHEMTVRALLELVPPRERAILELRFYGGLTQSEIAARMGISQMHVSRLLARSLSALRSRVAAS